MALFVIVGSRHNVILDINTSSVKKQDNILLVHVVLSRFAENLKTKSRKITAVILKEGEKNKTKKDTIAW